MAEGARSAVKQRGRVVKTHRATRERGEGRELYEPEREEGKPEFND
jgi:hypothetical protein